MDYNKMVGLYKWLPISISYLDVLTKSKFVNIRQLNEPLYDLVNSYEFEMIDNIIVTKDGMKFNLNKIKKILCEYFNIDQNNVIESLENAEKNINIKMSDLMIKTFNSYQLRKHLPNKTKVSKRNKAKKSEFITKTRRDIRRFKDLILNEEKYNVVNDCMFDEKRIYLYLAYVIMDYAEYYRNDIEKYNKAIDYLENYINLNQDLIIEDFSFSYIGYKKYSIKQIYEYVKRNKKIIKPKHNMEEQKIENYNYNFFEYDPVNKEEILKVIFKICNEDDNISDLKTLLKRKIQLYTSLNCKKIKVGVNSFSGYVGFLLDNGYVILDKFYDNVKDGKISNCNAIYVVKECDFEAITKLSKRQAINAISSGQIDAKRIIHSGDFETKVKKYV